MDDICRPVKPTCRWVSEISTAINNICGRRQLDLSQCNRENSSKIFNEFVRELKHDKCYNTKKVQDILRYTTDYNVYLEK